jgi:hypothetical protein
MYNSGGGDELGKIAIPAGDPGERLVANLIVSSIICQLHTLSKAMRYIEQAHELAVRLESQTITYRPDSPSKFARIELELQGGPRSYCFLSSTTFSLYLQLVRSSF